MSSVIVLQKDFSCLHIVSIYLETASLYMAPLEVLVNRLISFMSNFRRNM